MDYIEADDPLIEAEGAELEELADEVTRRLAAEEYAQLDAELVARRSRTLVTEASRMKLTISSTEFGKALSIAAQGAGARDDAAGPRQPAARGRRRGAPDHWHQPRLHRPCEGGGRGRGARTDHRPRRSPHRPHHLVQRTALRTRADSSTQVLTVRCGQHRTRLHGIDPDEYPPVREAPIDRAIEVAATTLASAVGQTVRCASRDEARAILTGVLVRTQEDALTLASTDGHRLAVRVIPATVPAALVGTSLIVPARALERLAKVRVSPESVVTVALAEAGNHVHFTVGDVEMASQVIEGTYPTYEPVIPTDAPTLVRATTALLLREVRTTSVLSPDAVGLITVVADDGGLTLRAQAAEVGQDEARLVADVRGPEVTIGFNAAYLRTALERWRPRR